MTSSITTAEVVRGLTPEEHDDLRDAVDAGYSPRRHDGSLAPARTLVAAVAA